MASKSLLKYNVLIVDNDIFMQKVMREMLRHLGLGNIDQVKDGAQALFAIGQTPYQLIICEFVLPVMGGVELAAQVRRAKFGNPEIGIIGYTKAITPELVLEARDAGINEIMITPFPSAVLERKVRAALITPRPFTRSSSYIGPCRRRKTLGAFLRRADDKNAVEAEQLALATVKLNAEPNAVSQEELAKQLSS